jgi:hypothetical protein
MVEEDEPDASRRHYAASRAAEAALVRLMTAG